MDVGESRLVRAHIRISIVKKKSKWELKYIFISVLKKKEFVLFEVPSFHSYHFIPPFFVFVALVT